MAFTHYTPTAQRNYGVEYSYTTGIPTQSSIFSKDYSITNTRGATRSETFEDKQVVSYDASGSYDSRFFSRSSSGLNGSNGAEYNYGQTYSSTESFYEFDNYLSSSHTGSGENGSTSSYASQATGEGQAYAGGGAYGQTGSSVYTELAQFNSTYRVYTTSRSASRSTYESYP